MTPSPRETQARTAVAARPTRILAEMLRLVDARDQPTAEERMVRAWIIDALETRHPAASQAVEDAFSRTDAALMNAPADHDPGIYHVNYVAVLLAAIPPGELR